MANEEVVDLQNNQEESELDKVLASISDEDKPSPEDMLAAFYEQHLKAVKHSIGHLGANALKRIIINVLMGEFATKEYMPNLKTKTGKAEKSVAFHFNEGVEKRMLLRFEQEYGKAQEALDKEQADLKKIDQMTNDMLTPAAKEMIQNHLDKEKENNG